MIASISFSRFVATESISSPIIPDAHEANMNIILGLYLEFKSRTALFNFSSPPKTYLFHLN